MANKYGTKKTEIVWFPCAVAPIIVQNRNSLVNTSQLKPSNKRIEYNISWPSMSQSDAETCEFAS